MSEGQDFASIQNFLEGRVETQYRAIANSAATGVVSSWPKAVQYLLRTDATPAAIRHATKDLNPITQSRDKDEIAYVAYIN